MHAGCTSNPIYILTSLVLSGAPNYCVFQCPAVLIIRLLTLPTVHNLRGKTSHDPSTRRYIVTLLYLPGTDRSTAQARIRSAATREDLAPEISRGLTET